MSEEQAPYGKNRKKLIQKIRKGLTFINLKPSLFFKSILLIAWTGFVIYLVLPKYSYNQKGNIRKHLYTGAVDILKWNGDEPYWERVKLAKNVSAFDSLPPGFELKSNDNK